MILKRLRDRLGIIFIFILLFTAFISVLVFSFKKDHNKTYVPLKTASKFKMIPSEADVFTQKKNINSYLNMPADENHQRTLKTYYDNRAFHGAPPTIPHPIIERQNIGGNDCLKCHENGGWVEKYKSYTPITPHPELVNCKQCHVPKLTEKSFVPNTFPKISRPSVGNNNVLLSSPPRIPHSLQMRNNCLSCHGGPSAPKEIRVSHPERTNCKQCHVPTTNQMIKLNIFKRDKKFVKLPTFNKKNNETYK